MTKLTQARTTRPRAERMAGMRYRPPAPGDVVVERHEGRLEARGREDPPGSGLCVAWPSGTAPRGRGTSPLLRAIGDAASVIDATGGFGVDAWTIARAGRRVTIIERSPVMAALLADALDRARRDDPGTASRVTLIEGDARDVLGAMSRGGERPDAVSIDPMFPPKRRASALPSKEMQFLAALVGPDGDAAELLEIARRLARDRVIVKRAPRSAPLAPGVDFSIASKLLRFDVYRTEPRKWSVPGSNR